MACQMSSDEDKSGMEDLIHHLEYCKVPQQDRKFYILDPTAWDWNDSYRSGLNDGVKAIMFAPTVSQSSLKIWTGSRTPKNPGYGQHY